MTVTSAQNLVSYAGDDSTTAFTVPFKFMANADLVVILRTNATGVDAVQTLTTHYSVTGAGEDAGGSLTMVTAPASGQSLVIYGDPALTQVVDYTTGDPFPAQTHENAIDLLTNQQKASRSRIDRALRFPFGDSSSLTSELPSSVDRASKVLGFDSSGNVQAVSQGDQSALTVTPSGATTARTLAERFGEVFNVKDYGATGDGVTDDAASIQLAVDAAETAGGGVVYFPRGTYVLTATVTIDNDRVELAGEGQGSRIATSGTPATCFTFDGGSDQLYQPGLRNLEIDATNVTSAALLVKGAIFGRFHNFQIFNSGAKGIDTGLTSGGQRNTKNVWDSILVYNATGNGFEFTAHEYDGFSNLECDFAGGDSFVFEAAGDASGEEFKQNSASNLLALNGSGNAFVFDSVVRSEFSNLGAWHHDTGAAFLLKSTHEAAGSAGLTAQCVFSGLSVRNCKGGFTNSATSNVQAITVNGFWMQAIPGSAGAYDGSYGIHLHGVADSVFSNFTLVALQDTAIRLEATTSPIVGTQQCRHLAFGNFVVESCHASGVSPSATTGAVELRDTTTNVRFGNFVLNQNNPGSDGSVYEITVANNCLRIGFSDFAIVTQVQENRFSIGAPENVRVIGMQTDSIAAVASGANVNLPHGTDFVAISGTADITSLSKRPRGSIVTLKFGATAATNGVVDGSNLKLAGDFAYANAGSLTLMCDGTDWYEISRSVN